MNNRVIKWLESDESYDWHTRRDCHTCFGHILGDRDLVDDDVDCNARQDFDIHGIPVTECPDVSRYIL